MEVRGANIFFMKKKTTLQTVNHGTEGNHQVTTRVVTWWLPRKVGEMVWVSLQSNGIDNEGGYLEKYYW